MQSVTWRRPYLTVVTAAFVAAFVALYPYLDLAGYCDDGGCPEVTQISASASPDLPANSVLATSAIPIAAAVLGVLTLLSLVQLRPYEVLLSPESPPPRS